MKEPVSPKEARSTAGGYGVDVQLGRLNGDPCCSRLVHSLIPTRVPGHISRCPTHVNSRVRLSANDLGENVFITRPMTGCRLSSSQLVNAYPTTPPAGPLNILFNPEKLSKSNSPPSDPINSTRGSCNPSSPSFVPASRASFASFPEPLLSLSSNPLKNPSRYSIKMGVRYASAVLDTPRGTILIMGRSWLDMETCANPISRAIWPTKSSWPG